MAMNIEDFMDGDFVILREMNGDKSIVKYDILHGVFVDSKGLPKTSIKNLMNVYPIPMSKTYLRMMGFKKMKRAYKLDGAEFYVAKFPEGWFVVNPDLDVAVLKISALHHLQHLIRVAGEYRDFKIKSVSTKALK